MRLGVFGLTPPKGIGADKALEWSIDEAAKLDVELLGAEGRAMFRWGTYPFDRGYWRELRQLAAERGVEIEPYVRSPFDLVGPTSSETRSAMVDSIRASRELGGPVMRTGYGDQTIARTRYGSIPLTDHLRLLESNLQEAARIAESEGIVFAVENHTDFTGREWDSVLTSVGSDQIRFAFDSANGMTIFANPLDDVAALARWTVTTHIKDMRVTQNWRPDDGPSPLVPFGVTGCPIGEGDLDLRAIIRRLVDESPLHADVPLIVEPSWPPVGPGESIATKRKELLKANLAGLRRIVREL